MRRALALAERGRGRTSPNPMVGALVVDEEGVIVGRGVHEFAGGPHAEVYALADAGPRARGATLYCTLEPCSHTGRTPPCAPQVAAAGIRRVVIATEDPNPLVSGRGAAFLRSHGVEVVTGVLARPAAALNRGFFTRIKQGRPFVTLKAALTLDGCVSFAAGQRTALTGAAANRLIHRERAEVDALAIGSSTLLTDDPLLTARGAYRYRPLVRVVFDRRLRTPPGARLFSTLDRGPVIIICAAVADEPRRERAARLLHRGARLEPVDHAGDESFLRAALARLAALDCGSLVVEGGPTLQRAFWSAGLADRVQLFVTSHVAGDAGVRWDVMPVGSLAALEDGTTQLLGEDTLIEGHVHRVD